MNLARVPWNMRTAASVLLLLAVIVPVAVAHGGTGAAQTHLSIAPLQLEPGQNHTIEIETGEGPWIAGMVFIVYVQFFNDARDLKVELLLGDESIVTSWTFGADERHKASTRIPQDAGPYHVRITNLAAKQTQLWFYFDQDCNCTFKPVPLDEGWVLFAYDLKKGHRYDLGFPLVRGWSVEGTVATLARPAAVYPEDFTILQRVTADGPRWLNFTFTPSADAKYYVFATATEGSPRFPNPDQNALVALTPLLEDKGGKSPAVGVAAVVACLVALALARRP